MSQQIPPGAKEFKSHFFQQRGQTEKTHFPDSFRVNKTYIDPKLDHSRTMHIDGEITMMHDAS